MERFERAVTSAIDSAGFDSAFFKYALRMSVDMQRVDGKSASRIRYSVYRHCARELKRKDVGMDTTDKPQYEYPTEVCDFLRKLTGGTMKREKKQVKVVVPIDVFCRALGVPERL